MLKTDELSGLQVHMHFLTPTPTPTPLLLDLGADGRTLFQTLKHNNAPCCNNTT